MEGQLFFLEFFSNKFHIVGSNNHDPGCRQILDLLLRITLPVLSWGLPGKSPLGGGVNLSVFSSHRGPLLLLVPLVQKLMEGPGKSCPGPGTFSVLDSILKGSCFIVQNKKKGILHLGFTCNLLQRRRMRGFRLPYFRRGHATRLKMRNTLFQTSFQSV